MIRVSVDIRSNGDCFRAAVGAGSIQRALSIARAHYPESEVELVFPIDPGSFFVRDSDLTEEWILQEIPEGMLAEYE